MGDGNNQIHLQNRVQGHFTYNLLEGATDNDAWTIQRVLIKIERFTLEETPRTQRSRAATKNISPQRHEGTKNHKRLFCVPSCFCASVREEIHPMHRASFLSTCRQIPYVYLTVFFAACFPWMAWATPDRDAEINALRNQMSALQTQLQAIQKRLDDLSRPAVTIAEPQPSSTESAAPKQKETKKQPSASVSYSGDGLQVRTSDNKFSLQVLTGLHTQWVVYPRSASENTTFSIRRIRPEFMGTVFQAFKYNFGFDLTGGQALLQNAYVDYTGLGKHFFIRAGQFKTPFGRESFIYSRLTLDFIEKSNLNSITTARNIGIGFGGLALGDRLKWDAAIINGNGINLANALNDNGAMDFAGRVAINAGSGLSLAGSLQLGKQPLNLRGAETRPVLPTESTFIFGGSNLPPNVLPSGTLATQGLRTRSGADFRWDFTVGSHLAFFQGEYVREVQRRERIPVGTVLVFDLPDFVRRGIMASGGVFLTGSELRGLQFIARVDRLSINSGKNVVLAAMNPVLPSQLFGNPFNIAGNRMTTVVIGANAYFHKRLRLQMNYYVQDLQHPTTSAGRGLARSGVIGFPLLQLQTVF